MKSFYLSESVAHCHLHSIRMARGRRRSTRTTSAATKREESSPLSDTHDSPADAMVIDESASSAQDAKPATKGLNSKNGLSDQSCPGCTQETSRKFNTFEKENWIMCDICKTWYHSRCAKLDGEYELDRIDKWCASVLRHCVLRQLFIHAWTTSQVLH